MGHLVLTCVEGGNADLFHDALRLYVNFPKAKIADVTYGKGVFWRHIPGYAVDKTDIQTGVDFRNLPYKDQVYDALVFDPPYLNGGSDAKESLNACYKSEGLGSHEEVLCLYLRGILECRRVLKKGGVLFVKCQAAVADHVQKLTHVQLMTILPMLGLRVEDEFVLKQSSIPLMRHSKQQHARKNHSYLLVFRRTR